MCLWCYRKCTINTTHLQVCNRLWVTRSVEAYRFYTCLVMQWYCLKKHHFASSCIAKVQPPAMSGMCTVATCGWFRVNHFPVCVTQNLYDCPTATNGSFIISLSISAGEGRIWYPCSVSLISLLNSSEHNVTRCSQHLSDMNGAYFSISQPRSAIDQLIGAEAIAWRKCQNCSLSLHFAFYLFMQVRECAAISRETLLGFE